MRFRDVAPVRFSFKNQPIVCLDMAMRASSVPEKNADKIIRMINTIIDMGSIIHE